MRRAPEAIWNFISPIVDALNYEFVGASLGQSESGLTLRVYIDREEGITVDDCATVSSMVGAGLDVEDLIAGEYCLEVSSPGMRRPLYNAHHYENQKGKTIKVRLTVPQDGRRNYTGVLTAVNGEQITVEVDNDSHELTIRDIDSANVVPKFG